MTAGVSSSLKRMDYMDRTNLYRLFNYTARFIVEATYDRQEFNIPSGDGFYLEHYSDIPPAYPSALRSAYGSEYAWWNVRDLVFTDIKILAGDPGWFNNYRFGESVGWDFKVKAFAFHPDSPDGVMLGYPGFFVYERSLTMLHPSISYWDEAYSHDFLGDLVPGERYIIVGRLNRKPQIG